MMKMLQSYNGYVQKYTRGEFAGMSGGATNITLYVKLEGCRMQNMDHIAESRAWSCELLVRT
jgi:hypothetical protein